MKNLGIPEHPALIGLSSDEVAHVTGVPLRNITEWIKRRLLPIGRVGKGSRRHWSQSDILAVCLVAALREEGVPPGRAGRLIKEDADLSDVIISAEGKARIEQYLDACMQRALTLQAEKPRRKDLRMAGSFYRTKISRGECGFAGVCVKGLTLIISEGMGGAAYAAELSHNDAKNLLAEMDKALAEDDGNSATNIYTFEQAHLVAILVGRPLALSIGAGEQGAAVARMTCEDFQSIRDALRDSLRTAAFPVEVPAVSTFHGGEVLPDNIGTPAGSA